MEQTILERYFQPYREQVIGQGEMILTPYGQKKLIYADWIASGRLYRPIEEKLSYDFGPWVGNTHTETNITGTTMTLAYEESKKIIKHHVNADPECDILIMNGSGMTDSINKLIRILGWRVHENYKDIVESQIPKEERPLIFTTIMEHHSNEITWRESMTDVEYIPFCENSLMPDIEKFEALLEKHKDRKNKVAAISACSNVTGIKTDYHRIAKVMHQHGGYCFVDFAACAPYTDIDMHPADPEEQLDAIYFSPHKFLGGPGTPGVLVFNKCMYKNTIPDVPGGGTVKWVNRWGEQSYYDAHTVHGVEAREDGGTPPFMQTIKTAMCVLLKEEMGTDNIMAREHELLAIAMPALKAMDNITVLKEDVEDRLGIISFYMNGNAVAYNLMVKLLNDRYGIQVRGGCACAGPYGHCLLKIDYSISSAITEKINNGDSSQKPGWVRLSLHPLMTNEELYFILDAIKEVCDNFEQMKEDYYPIEKSTDWKHKEVDQSAKQLAAIREIFGVKPKVVHS